MDEQQLAYALGSLFALALGLVVGSFLNVCICRLPAGESVVSPRSRCPKCGNAIVWYDNIPLVSWLILGAKCRHCGQPISWQYPLVEAITGTLFFLVFWKFGFTLATPIYMALAAALIVVTFVDLTTWTIPNEISMPGIPAGLICAIVATWLPESGVRVPGPLLPVFDALIGMVVGGGIILLLDQGTQLILKKPGMGMGDVKLLAMLGAFFGWAGVILILMIASVLGSVIGLITVSMAKRREGADQEASTSGDENITLAQHYLPFAPYLCFAGLVVMFFGQEMYDWYTAFMDIGAY